MNLSYINTMVSNLAACYWHAHKERIAVLQMHDHISEIVKFAQRGSTDTDLRVTEAAEKLIVLLKKEGVNFDEVLKNPTANALASPAQSSATQAAPKPVATKIASQVWDEFEAIATDAIGPIASRIVFKIKSAYPFNTPRQLISKFEEALGKESSNEIFSMYKK
jgi:hypothetical protein